MKTRVALVVLLVAATALAQIQSNAPQLPFVESDQSGALGRWRFLLSGDVFALQKNSAAGRDYSTVVTPISIAATGVTTFSAGPVITGLTASRLVATDSGGALASFANGTSGQILRSAGAASPAWSTATFPGTATAGDLLYASGANAWGNLADVATGSVLISGGVGAAPSWSTTAAVGTVDASTALTGTVKVLNTNAATYTINTGAATESRRTVHTAAQDCVYTLPAATVGMTVTFIAPSAGGIDITVQRAGADVIIDTTGSAYTQAVMGNTAGTSLTLVCIEANKWTVAGAVGTVTLS